MRLASFLLFQPPPRIRGSEWLDDNALDPAIALRSLQDIRRTNLWFGGTAAVLAELRGMLPPAGAGVSLLDVGTGAGDIPAAARAFGLARGVVVKTIGLDWTLAIAASAKPACGLALTADARRLPLADRSVDIVTCSQVLHHFDEGDARALIAELHRVARVGVIIGELRRSLFAAAGVWLASWPLGFHPASRHDGVVSVMRGFMPDELQGLVVDVTGVKPAVQKRWGFRVTASWRLA